MGMNHLFKNTGRLAFWSMMLALVFQLISFSEAMRPFFPLHEGAWESQAERMLILSMMGRVWLVTGIVLISKVLINKEPRGLAFKLAAPGLALLLILELIAIFSQVIA